MFQNRSQSEPHQLATHTYIYMGTYIYITFKNIFQLWPGTMCCLVKMQVFSRVLLKFASWQTDPDSPETCIGAQNSDCVTAPLYARSAIVHTLQFSLLFYFFWGVQDLFRFWELQVLHSCQASFVLHRDSKVQGFLGGSSARLLVVVEHCL